MTQRERIKIAQELHDGIAQDLVGLSYSLDLLLAAPETPSVTRMELRTILFKVSALIESVRAEIFNLRAQELLSFEQSLRIQVLDPLHSSRNPIYAEQPSPAQSHNQYQELCRPC